MDIPMIIHNGANEVLRVIRCCGATMTLQKLDVNGAQEIDLTYEEIGLLCSMVEIAAEKESAKHLEGTASAKGCQ